MGDHLKRVKSGDPLVIPASTFNLFIDAAQAHQAGQRAVGGEGIRSLTRAGTVQVQNDSGADVGRFGVLGIDGPVIGPDDNLVEFQGRLTLSGVTPVAGMHDGRFVILLDPLGAGRIGRACASGLTVARVDVSDVSHGYADIDDGDASHLASGDSGAAAILWKEAGTGEKWAVVKLGSPDGTVANFSTMLHISGDAGQPGGAWFDMPSYLGIDLDAGIKPDFGGTIKRLSVTWAEIMMHSAGNMKFRVTVNGDWTNAPETESGSEGEVRGGNPTGLAFSAGDVIRVQGYGANAGGTCMLEAEAHIGYE